MGAQCYTSKSISDTLNPKWNFNCQFFIKDLYQDVLCITVFEKDQFSPDGESADTAKRRSHRQKGVPAFCPVRIKGLNGRVPGLWCRRQEAETYCMCVHLKRFKSANIL